MTRERSILHLNTADFAVAVERVADPALRERPVIVAPLQAARAAVYDMSDEAYGDGVRKGMPLREAVRLCRSASILPPRPDLYRRAMKALVTEARNYTPVLEYGIEDGHLFLDITGTHRLFGTAPEVGWRLHREVRGKLGLDPIWSVAANKLVSKVASRLVKPIGEYIVAAGEEETFLAPLSLALLPGLSSREMCFLRECNINRVGQLASLTRAQLGAVFGSRADTLYEISRGCDSALVLPVERHAQTIRREHVFADDTGDRNIIEGVVRTLACQVAMQLRTCNLAGRRLAIELNYTDGSRVVRQAAVRRGVSDDFSLQSMALLALQRTGKRRTRVRGCRLMCDRLHRRSTQLDLFAGCDSPDGRKKKLLAAMDAVRSRFGMEAIRTGSQAVLH